FNFVRMSVGHSRYRADAEPETYWAWGGTPENPDFDRFNPKFFRAFENLLRQMAAEGLNAEILVMNLYRPPFNQPVIWTADRQRQWIRNLTARYAAFPNVFMWTI